jgi:hypothetical protein
MPTKREREYYRMGFDDGVRSGRAAEFMASEGLSPQQVGRDIGVGRRASLRQVSQRRTTGKRKLSAWNKFVKANAKKPRFRLRSGAPNLKKLGVAFRKTPAGRKKRR